MKEKIILISLMLLVSMNFLFAEVEIINNASNNEVRLVNNWEREISIDYKLNHLSARIYTCPEGDFTQLFLDNYGLTGELGKPQLPYSSKIIVVPEGAKVITQLKIGQTRQINLSDKGLTNKIFPAQAPVSKSSRPEDIEFVLDNQIYQTGDFIDQEKVIVKEIGYQRGMRLFQVNYYPVAYNPSTNTIAIINEASLNIKFEGADLVASQYLRDKTFSPAFEVNYPSTIFNYRSNRSSLESYPLGYIVVAPNNYLDTLEAFIEWKTQQGYDVTVLDTDIVGTSTAAIKSAISNIWDSATPTNPAPSYLLICGDVEQVPAFASTTLSGHISDLSYVRLEGSDYLPEMYYGRFSATNTSQLSTIVNKTLMYEKYEMPDPSYLERATLIAGVDASWAPTHGNGTINYGSQYYFNAAHDIDATSYYYPESGSSEASIIADVNAGLGYLNYTAHGSETTWHDPHFSVSDVNSLTNSQQYPVVVGNCCLTNHFDTSTSFGESWLRATNGAVIYIGGTNSTYWDEDYWWSVGHFSNTNTANPTYAGTGLGMFDALFHENGEEYVNWVNSAGSMVYRGNMTVQGSSSDKQEYYWEIYSIMGDPSLIPYIGIPDAQNPSYTNTLFIGSSSLDVTAAPYSYVSLTVDGVIIGTQILDSNGSGSVNFPALTTPQSVKMVISRVDYQPYIADIQVVTADGPYLTLSDYSFNDANNNGLLEYGESASLNLVIENIGTATSPSGTITFSESDPYINLTSTSASVTAISSEGSININNVINFAIANNIPNNHTMNLSYVISAGGEVYSGNLTLTGKSYEMEINAITIDDSALGNGNNVIDAGESFSIIATVENVGAAISPLISASIADASYITYVNSTATIAAISAGSSNQVIFSATASNTIPAGEEVTFTVTAPYLNGNLEFSQDFLAALLQIGEGTVTEVHLPIEPYYGYTYSQSIYTASELNLGVSQINKIAYHYNGNSTWTDNIVVYMGNTTKTSFSSTSDWIALANITEVYNGTFTAPATAGWVEITLDTPFTYDGSSNLVIGIDENTSGYHASDDEFYCYSSGSNRSIYYYSDSINPDPASPVSGNLSGNNPNIRIFASSTSAEPNIVLNTTSLDFGEVILGNSVTRDFTITNTGGASLIGTIILPDNFTFATRNSEKEVVNTRTSSQNFTLPAGNNQTYSIIFTPTTELCYNSNIEISHNADQYSSYISLVACGIKPTYSSETRLITKTLAPDTQDTYNYVINNVGSGDLEVLVEITDADRYTGGPDAYGYTWKDSNEAGVTYNWIDISATGTIISEGDDTSEAMTLPFTFSFYGEEYTSLNVSSNGFLSFTSTSSVYSNQTIPNSADPNAIIAPFWDDLKPYGTIWGNVYYQNFSTYSVIQWENVSHFSSSQPTDNETFQVILYNNGDIKYQYQTVENNTSCTVGIENQAGDDGLLINYNSDFLVDEYALLISAGGVSPNWLSLTNDNLLIPEGSSETITLNFDANGLELGTYNKNLYLITNDPDHEEFTIPVTLIVGGSSQADILVDKQEIDFGSVTAGEFIMETITITNIGGETLTGNISADNGFTITEARANTSKNEIMAAHQAMRRIRNFDFSLTSGTSKSYDVSHSTVTAGLFSGNITITSNDPESSLITLPLTLEVINPAQIDVNPQSLALNLQPEQSADRTISISNLGDLDLTCSLNLQVSGAREVTEIFTANFDNHDLSDWSIDYLYSADHTWHIADDYSDSSIDGSSFLFIDSDATGSSVDFDDTIETPTFNVSAYEEITIEFDHYFNSYQSEIADVDFWTGSQWINIGRWQGEDIGAWSVPSQFNHTLTNNGYTDVKLRFHYYEANYDWYWAIDNLVVSGQGSPTPQWVTLPSQYNNLTITPENSEDITLNFTSVDFIAGQYTASLNIQSNSAANNFLSIPITLTVSELENEPDWQPVIYPNNSATIYAEVTHLSDEIAVDDIVSAWVGDECRGLGQIVIVNRSQAFTTIVVQSNGTTENVYFKLYDRSADIVEEESNSTPVTSGQVVGSAQVPFTINIGVIELIAPNYLEVQVVNSLASLNWLSVPNADYYKIYFSTDLSNWIELADTNNTSYQHNQPRSNTEAYFYKIKAIKN